MARFPGSPAGPRLSIPNALLAQASRRPYLVCTAIALFLFFVITRSYTRPSASWQTSSPSAAANFDGKWNYARDAKNLQLSTSQCNAAFPDLYTEIDTAVRHWKEKGGIRYQDLDNVEPKNGYVRAMIHDGDLYVIAVRGEVYRRHYASLAAIHRALVTTPAPSLDAPIPDIEFTFNVDDTADAGVPQWSYARRRNEQGAWLMPDFGYYSWPETKVGTYNEVQRKAIAMENGVAPSKADTDRTANSDVSEAGGPYTWATKHPQLMWRGATMGLEVRESFVNATAGKTWADVKTLDWHDDVSMKEDLKSMAQHCQYRYLAHTEGNSYSGRLKYLQNCRSVLVTHPLEWIQHYQGLMISSGARQNFVEVRRDFADLESTILGLEKGRASAAEKIAEESVRVFRERYLTPAAEACYWRALMRGWASAQGWQPEFWGVQRENGTLGRVGLEKGEMVWRGVPWESYSLMRTLEWKPQ